MPPKIALILCVIFILYLFIIDTKRESNVSSTIWIPLIWMIIIGSRFVSQWLNPGTPIESPDVYIKGSPIDRNIFILLIVSGLFILSRRKIYWLQILQRNPWILLLFLYGGISTLWSDFAFVSFKRWIKTLGNLVMIIVILTEADPVDAMKTVMKRCAYVFIPLSVLFIKYYPELGRSYSSQTWETFYHGVGGTKNDLGIICFICGTFLFWDLLTMWRQEKGSLEKKQMFVHALILVMILWLLKMANSATSITCFVIGICIVIVTGLPIFKRNVALIGIYIFMAALASLMLQLSLDIVQTTIGYLGREATLTGRIPLWKTLINMATYPLTGFGYESFWLGERVKKLWEMYWWHPNQAHNGYLEIYLNLGLIGLILLTGVVVSAYRKIKKELISNFDYARFRMMVLITTLIYNVTEGLFKGLNLVFFVFLLIAVECPRFLEHQTPEGTNHGSKDYTRKL